MLNEAIQKKLQQLPEAPGVYKMLNDENNIIYIGKSKCLKKRVSSYFVAEPTWEKAKKMAHFIRDIEYIVTDTHLEAMLLECLMIKKIRPYFNVIMKHDDRYVYLGLGSDRRKNPLNVSYVKNESAFGPLRSRGRTEELVVRLRNFYPLTFGRGGKIKFSYHIFPEVMDETAFLKNRQVLERICTDGTVLKLFIQEVERCMQRAVRQQKFEYATKYRDLANSLKYLESGLNAYRELLDRDIIYAVPIEEGYKMFYISKGLLVFSEKVNENSDQQRRLFAKCVADMEDRHPDIREKEIVDYRAIVYTELMGADADCVIYWPPEEYEK